MGKALPPIVAVNSEVKYRLVSAHSGDECSVEEEPLGRKRGNEEIDRDGGRARGL